jgi:hypothetical protein
MAPRASTTRSSRIDEPETTMRALDTLWNAQLQRQVQSVTFQGITLGSGKALNAPHPSLSIPFRYALGEFPVHFLNDRRKLAASENPMRSAT